METQKITYIKAKTSSKDLVRFKRQDEAPGWTDLFIEVTRFAEEEVIPDIIEITVNAVNAKTEKPQEPQAPEPKVEEPKAQKPKKQRKPRNKPAAVQVPDVIPQPSEKAPKLEDITQMSDEDQSEYFRSLAQETEYEPFLEEQAGESDF